MSKYLSVVGIFLCLLFVLPSCKGDKDNTEEIEQEAYKQKNDAAFEAKASDLSYVKWMSQANDGYVFAKLITKGTGKKIYYNSRISVYYKGWKIDGTVFDSRLFDDGAPLKCAVSSYYANYNSSYNPSGYMSVLEGWGVALQNMVEGDKYEIWIPQQLGNGSEKQSGSTDAKAIPAYSTLIFEIEVVSVDEQAAHS